MGRFKENPRHNCISARLNDDEFEEVLQVCDQTRRTVSDLVREAVFRHLDLAKVHAEEGV